MGIRKNLFKNAGASFFGKTSNALIRIVQVPLLIYFLGVEDFGRWTVLYTIPSWLTLANFGFGTVATNQMCIHVAENDLDKAKKVFSTTFVLLLFILLAGMSLAFIFVPLVNWETFLDVDPMNSRETEFRNTVFFMAASVFITFFYGIYDGVFKAARKAHFSILLISLLPWLNLLAMFIVLNYSTRFDWLALAVLISNVFFVITYALLSHKSMPNLSFSINQIQSKTFRSLFKKGFAFQAFPLGNALTIQGNILVIQYLLGPTAVALFSTIKTIVNLVKQVIDIINQASWPELSHLLGQKDFIKAAKLHRFGVAISIVISILGTFFLLIFGKFIYTIWTGNQIDLPMDLFILMLLPIPFNALWFTSSVIHLAGNLHEKLAKRYLLYSIISFIISVILTYLFGLNGMAISLLTFEILLIPFVVNYSIAITQDNWKDFKKETFRMIFKNPKTIIKHLKKNP